MFFFPKRIVGIFCFLICLACASCVTTTMPKSARVEPSPSASGPADAELDSKLADTWELLYQVNDKGEEERPRDATRTLIEFTGKGQVIFNRMDKENSDRMKSRRGKYTIQADEILITDDAGNTVKWPYQIAGDTLIVVMPEVKKKFYWRRFR